MRIAVLDDYHRIAHELADWSSLNQEVAFFDRPIPPERIPSVLHDFDTLVLMRERTAFPRELLERLPNLATVITTGMRNASLDVDYLRSRGVRVYGTGMSSYGPNDPPDPGGAGSGSASPVTVESPASAPPGVASTVEVAWALILSLFKHVAWEDRALRQGIWQQQLPTNLAGARLGLVGLGRLGAQMVAPARAFGMEVVAWSQNLTPERAAEHGVGYATKDELLQTSDVISVHLVLSDRTRNLIGAAELARMKPTAFLVNTSRGPIVEEQALVQALEAGRIGGAGLDVYATEPLPHGSPLASLPNTVLTPHLGYVSREGLTEMYLQVVEDLAAHLAGAPIRVIA